MRNHLVAEAVEVLLRERLVDRPPPDPLLGLGLLDDELVPGRTAGKAAGVDDERPALGKAALAPLESVRVEQRRSRLPVDTAVRVEPVAAERRLGRDRDR
jgi:hypothetical protein